MSITITAPAKVNMRLRIVGRRADGYHLLQMIMVPLEFGDTLTLSAESITASPQWFIDDGIALHADHAGIPLNGDHLCVRAARAMRHAADRHDPIAMRLVKRTPVAAGLGGGSSDAAAVLLGLNQLWDLQWPIQRLADIGLRLGADVPFFCWGQPALVTGIGERVEPLQKFPKLPILLVNPNHPVATPEVYRRYAESHGKGGAFCLTDDLSDARCPRIFERFEDVTACLVNDLEPITTRLVPELTEIRMRLQAAHADAVLMSGSGPTMFGVFRTIAARDTAHAALQGTGWWCCATSTTGA